MKFRIVYHKERTDTPYEIFYFDEFDNRGPRWQKLILDEAAYCHFRDNNFVATIADAKTKAKDFYYNTWLKEHGQIVDEFEIN